MYNSVYQTTLIIYSWNTELVNEDNLAPIRLPIRKR